MITHEAFCNEFTEQVKGSVTLRDDVKDGAKLQGISNDVAQRFVCSMAAGVITKLKALLKEGDTKSELRLPWGAFTVTAKGPAIGFTPSAILRDMIDNGIPKYDLTKAVKIVDEDFLKGFAKFMASGTLGDDQKEFNKLHLGLNPKLDKAKPLHDDKLVVNTVTFIMDVMGRVMASQVINREGGDKITTIAIGTADAPHGEYRFERREGNLVVRFEADKALKQLLKDDVAKVG